MITCDPPHTNPRLLNEEVGYYLCPAIIAAARKATVPVCFHLDHGANEKEVQKALRWGATGIMYDGSVHSFEENIANTKHIIEICDSIDITVEGELGHVGSVNDDVMEEYRNRCLIKPGTKIKIFPVAGSQENAYTATCLGIDQQARLQVITESGQQKFLDSGEVSLQSLNFTNFTNSL